MAQLVTWAEFGSGQLQGGTIKEVVFPEVVNLISKKRPLMSVIGNDVAETLLVERLEDTLRSRAANAYAEGPQFTNPELTQPSRLVYHVQRFCEFGEVSDEQRSVAHYNGDPFSYQISKSMEQMLNDVEHAMHRGSTVSGASGTARQFDGLLNIFPGEATWTTDASGTTLTEAVFVDILQSFADNNYDRMPNTCFVNSGLKRTISEYSTKVTREISALNRLQSLIIERHTSDFGDVDIFYSEDQLKGNSVTEHGHSICFIDRDSFSKGWHKQPSAEPLTREGFSSRYQMTTQCTLIYKSKKAGGGGTGYVPNVTVT
jgi:hypothetical protein